MIFAESELPEAYRMLCQNYGVKILSPEAIKTLSRLVALQEGGPFAMIDCFQEDNAEEFDGNFFVGCTLPTKAMLGH